MTPRSNADVSPSAPVFLVVKRPKETRAPQRQSGRQLPRTPLLALLVAAIAAALLAWREPLELWVLRRGPADGLERYAAAHPDSSPAAVALGEAYLQQGRAEAARRVLEPFLEKAPEDVSVRFTLARALMESGHDGDAYAHFQVIVNTLRPGDRSSRWYLGELLERSGKTNEAYDQYDLLSNEEPRSARALVRMGALALGDGRNTKAEEILRRAVRVDPHNAEAHARLAEVLFSLGNSQEAAEFARRAVQLHPGDVRGSYWLGRALLTLDARSHHEEVERAFKTVVDSSEEGYTARYYLAKLYQELGRTREAAEQLELTTRENPLYQKGFYDLSLCERALGNRAKADEAMRQFRKLNAIDEEGRSLEYRLWSQPGNIQRMVELAQHYVRHKRPDLARPLLQRILRQTPHHQQALRLQLEIDAHPQPSL